MEQLTLIASQLEFFFFYLEMKISVKMQIAPESIYIQILFTVYTLI